MRSWMLIGCIVLFMSACSAPIDGDVPPTTDPPPDTQTPPITAPTTTRTELTYGQMTGTDPTSYLVHNGYYAPVGPTSDDAAPFAGLLHVDAGAMTASRTGVNRMFPGFDVPFYSYQDYLVPTRRDIMIKGTGDWTLILSPGKIWRETADNGMSRAAFPFLLGSLLSNESHNGVATFLYDGAGCSNVRLQIVQENAAWNVFTAHATLGASYTPGSADGFEADAARFGHSLERRFPTASWSDLEALAGGSLTRFDAGMPSDHITYKGVVYDGVLYLPPCDTPAGPFPYPDYMRAGAFSVTKSIGAALTLMHLAHKYGPELYNRLITEDLTVEAGHDGWAQVTWADCLNMATGIGNNNPNPNATDVFADENTAGTQAWSTAQDLDGKLAAAWAFGNLPWGPNEVVRYNTTHTFVLAAAMDAFVKSREGADVSLWDLMRTEVLETIGIYDAPMMHTVEADGSRGVPHFGVGAYPTPDDLAKLITLFQNRGVIDGVRLLEPTHLTKAMFITQSDQLGIGTADDHGDPYLYHHGLWSDPYRVDGCSTQVPYMSGFGGNMVVMLPNGLSAFRFGDDHVYDTGGMILDLTRIKGMCTEHTD